MYALFFFQDLQDLENPYHFWPVTITANRGCFLSLEYAHFKDQEETLFYLSPKLFPKGYAADKEVINHFSVFRFSHRSNFWILLEIVCFLKDLLFLHQCIYNIIIERTYKINKLIKHTVKQFMTGKDSYILSYVFQREGSKNLTVFFCSGLTIDLIKYYFRPCKPRNFVFRKGFVCSY